MSDTRMTIRNIDSTLYRRARMMAVENDISVGELINHSLEFFLEEAILIDAESHELSQSGTPTS